MNSKSNYIVLARKYRPKRLSDLIGQEEICNIIQGSVKLNRIAHAFLFSGTRGVGKTSIARILAKIVNCISNDSLIDPCGKCSSCVSIDKESNIDVVIDDNIGQCEGEDVDLSGEEGQGGQQEEDEEEQVEQKEQDIDYTKESIYGIPEEELLSFSFY